MRRFRKLLITSILSLSIGLTSCGDNPIDPVDPSPSGPKTEEEKWQQAVRLDSLDDEIIFRRADYDSEGKLRLKIGGFESYHYYGVILEYRVEGSFIGDWTRLSTFAKIPMQVYEEDNTTLASTLTVTEFLATDFYNSNIKLDYLYHGDKSSTISTDLYGAQDFIFKGSDKDFHILFTTSNNVRSDWAYRVSFYRSAPLAHVVGEDSFCPSYHTDHFDGYYYTSYLGGNFYGGTAGEVKVISGTVKDTETYPYVRIYLTENMDTWTLSGDSPFDGNEFKYDISVTDLNGNALTKSSTVFVEDYFGDVGYSSGDPYKAVKFSVEINNIPHYQCSPSGETRYFFKVVLTAKDGYDTSNVVGFTQAYHMNTI